ncbi:YobI family P-loop NTPase [Mammaliicoccus sciuri]|uniref:YobI family P-loop NTPase n=1 Tax=Mammaliicoccus sciuri TaxID=1296 RepID=UPI003F55F185
MIAINNESKTFFNLTPENNVDIKAYEAALNHVFMKNNNINNIAITGGYGTGKSTLINTYIKKKDLSSHMYVHLGSFETFSPKNSENVKGKILDTIEEKIISQILHQIPSNQVPKSIFRIKEKNKFFPNFLLVISTIILFLTISYLFFSKRINILESIFGEPNSLVKISLLLIICSLFGVYMYKFINIQKTHSLFKRLKFYGSEVELGDKIDYSYFDKYMNDIIYLFINSGKNIFIFEDLDRFNEPKIFEKLIEINTLLNKHCSKKEEKKFVYLLRDDIFTSKDRLKIFDFIIPVIPIIAYGNSSFRFKKLLEQVELSNEFDFNIVDKILIYIDDMRLLKNIINEYIIYKSKINIEHSETKLFSILVYKNIFPYDFYLFQYGRSFIDFIYSHKDSLIMEKKNAIDSEINDIKEEIERIKNTVIKNRYEIIALNFNFSKYFDLKVNGKSIKDFANNAEFIKAVIENNNNITYRQNSYYANTTDKDLTEEISNIENLININNYPELFGKVGNLEHRLQELYRQMDKIEYLEFNDLLFEKGTKYFMGLADEDNRFKYLKNHRYINLIIFLLSEALIDRNSLDYISFQEDEDISVSDRIYLRKLFDREKNLENYEISNPKEVLDRLQENDIIKYKVKNTNITEYIIINKQNDKLKELISLCKTQVDYDHVVGVFNLINNDEIETYFLEAILNSSILLEEVLSNLANNLKSEFLIKILKNIKRANLGDLLSDNYIKREFENLYINDKNIEHILTHFELFSKYNYKFYHVILSNSNVNSYFKLIKYQLLKVSTDNILNIFDVFDIYIDKFERYISNINHIHKLNIKQVEEYFLSNNINEYLQSYLEVNNNNAKFNDKFNLILNLMKNDKLDESLMKKYLKNMNTSNSCTNLNEIPTKFVDTVISCGLYFLTNENIEYLFTNFKNIPKSLDQVILEKRDYIKGIVLSEKNNIKFIEYIIKTQDKFIIEIYLSNISTKIKDTSKLNIDSQDFLVLLENNLIEFNDENLIEMLEKYPEIFGVFNNIELKNLNINTLTKILNSDEVSITFRKEKMLENINRLELNLLLSYIQLFKLDVKLIEVLNRKVRKITKTPENIIILKRFNELGLLAKLNLDFTESIVYVSGKKLSVNKNYNDIDLNKFFKC